MKQYKHNDLIKAYYLSEISLLDVADSYFKEGFYSAAATFYSALFNNKRNDSDFEIKSYICSQCAKCYLNQNQGVLSNWQYSTIYNYLQTAINYNPNNILAHKYLADYYLMKERTKDAYFTYEYIILNLLDEYYYDLNNDDIMYMIRKVYEIGELCHIIKYKAFESKIYSFLGNQDYLTQEEYNEIIKIISDHHQKIDEEELNIIESKYIYN